ncbi:multicopper oxidase domain-containing protein [Geodermatophilus sp. URMC 62]|uniref:multicopper oxidase domain-containing protein n=1 Tax=Geodermatophilus sp. URMC 62 TaxID=3423414 RepID=UPI00406D2CAD
MELNRRQLFRLGAASAAVLAFPAGATTPARAATPAGLSRFTEPLPTMADLGVLDATAGAATLRTAGTLHRYHADLPPTPSLAYQGAGGQTCLGPVVVARRGVPFDLTVVDGLTGHPLAGAIDTSLVQDAISAGLLPGPADQDRTAPRTALHLHGGNTAADSDGGPLDTVPHGGARTHHYDNAQAATALWYHDHAMATGRLNVLAGLAGLYLLRDDDDPGDGSRLPGGPYEVPLLLQDRSFADDGSLAYPVASVPGSPRTWVPEFFGDVSTVNGRAWPTLGVDRGRYRFRIVNAANSRFYRLRFLRDAAALPFWQIGTDGGLLDAPVPLDVVTLGPGERADLVVDFSDLPPGTDVVLGNDAPAPYRSGAPGDTGGPALPEVMRFTVGEQVGTAPALPARLRAVPVTRLEGLPVAATRTMTLVHAMDMAGGPMMALLNNRTFASADYTTAPVAADTVEQWEFVNGTGVAHPIHLHYTQFQVLDRQQADVRSYSADTYGPGQPMPDTGPYPPPPATPYLLGRPRPPAAEERGWKDTVVALPGEVTRIRVPFGAGAAGGAPLAMGSTFRGEYVWHCHLLEHEDNEMMQRFVVR